MEISTIEGFARYWKLSPQQYQFRGLIRFRDDQAPITRCVCCPGLDVIRISGRAERCSRKTKQNPVDGIQVAEVISSTLRSTFEIRAWQFLDEKVRGQKMWDSERQDHCGVAKYLTSIWVPPSAHLLQRLGWSTKNIELAREHPLSFCFKMAELENAPLRVNITRRTKHTGAVYTFADWKGAWGKESSIQPNGLGSGNFRDHRKKDYVVRAVDLKKGYEVLVNWLALGIAPEELSADRDRAEIAAQWLYPSTYYGSRTGASKIKQLKKRFHHPCSKHREFVDDIFN